MKNNAVWTGLEPATPCVTGMYSNRLNYQTNAFKSAASLSNAGAKIDAFFNVAKFLREKCDNF